MQLCEEDHDSWKIIDDEYRSRKRQSSQESEEPEKLGIDELADLIVHCSEYLRGAVIILDALNETKESLSLFDVLLSMTYKTSYLKILISSTQELGLEKRASPVTIVSMEKENIANDIEMYVNTQLQNKEVFRHLSGSLRQDIKAALCDRADGRYATQISA